MLSTKQRNVIKARLQEEFDNKNSEIFDVDITCTSAQGLANLVMEVVMSDDCFPDIPDEASKNCVTIIQTKLQYTLDAMIQDDMSIHDPQFLDKILYAANEIVAWILPKTVDILSEDLLGKIRQNQGAEDENDTSKDETINILSKTELLGSVLEWEGIQGYTEDIISWVEEIFGVTLPRE